MPANVTIAAGASSATFTATSRTVASSTSVTVTATYNGSSRNATLTVAPAGGGPLAAPSLVAPASDARFRPGQSITFDWSDVAGAATYTIQIDDSSSFSAPLTVSSTVAFSQLTTSSLPTTRMWWRVRANDGSGAAGAWSGARRFEVKN